MNEVVVDFIEVENSTWCAVLVVGAIICTVYGEGKVFEHSTGREVFCGVSKPPEQAALV